MVSATLLCGTVDWPSIPASSVVLKTRGSEARIVLAYYPRNLVYASSGISFLGTDSRKLYRS